jgi:hypothetical protein
MSVWLRIFLFFIIWMGAWEDENKTRETIEGWTYFLLTFETEVNGD